MSNSDLLNLASIVTGIIGIIAGFIIARRSQRVNKAPCWTITTTNLIEDYSAALDGLKVTFNDNDVKDLSVSRIAFWNAGTASIDYEDVTSDEPFRVMGIGEVKILDAIRVHSNEKTNNFSVAPANEHMALLNFKYLGEKQGAIIQIVHTGLGSDDIKVVGVIKEGKKLQKKSIYGTYSNLLNKISSIYSYIIMFLLAAPVLLFIFLPWEQMVITKLGVLPHLLISIAIILPAFTLAYSLYNRGNLPKGFTKLLEGVL
jgi:hypothetical protein